MKILYITTTGITMKFFTNFIQELIKEGNVVDIATNEKQSKVPTVFEEFGCKIYQISTSRSPFSFGNIKAIKQIRTIAKDYDIVHCHTPLAGIAARLACRPLREKKGLKVFYTAHGFHFYKGAPIKNWLIYYPAEKMCSRWTDVLITITREDYELAKKKMKANRIEYVPGVGIDINRFASTTTRLDEKKTELQLPKDSFVVLSVGELNRNKNHKAVVKAISLMNDPRIYYLIAGVGNQKNKLLSLAKELNVNLRLLGFRNDVNELYKIADVFVLPSIREGLNVSMLESIAAGCKTIVSQTRGNADFVDSKNMFKPNDVNRIAKLIKTDIENNPLPNLLDVKNINKKLLNIYSEKDD